MGEALIDFTPRGEGVFCRNAGGAPANVAVCAARLGAPAAMITKLGRDMLYDGAKYFHRGFERYRQLPYKLDELHATSVYLNSTFTSATFVDNKDSFEKYLDHYYQLLSMIIFMMLSKSFEKWIAR